MKRFIAVSTLVLMLLFPAGPVLAAYTITIGPFGYKFSDEVFPFYVFLIMGLLPNEWVKMSSRSFKTHVQQGV